MYLYKDLSPFLLTSLKIFFTKGFIFLRSNSSNLMEELLENEGIKVENNIIVDFENYFWDPSENL